MTTETPWSESEFGNQLDQKLGSDWAQQLEHSLGSDWQESCAQELAYQLGEDWADRPEIAAEKLVELVTAATAQPASEQTEQSWTDSDQPLPIDFSEYGWLNSIAQSDSVQSWLVQVGVPAEEAAMLADESGELASGEPATEIDPDQPLSLDLSECEWLNTVFEADSLESWLVRIGVTNEFAAELAGAEG